MPNWIDKNEYPFESRYAQTRDGHMLHYVDEGKGDVILMLHGTPEWSFGYRHLIKKLSNEFRCVAPDLLGFGLSDKPQNADYTCKAHAARLENFIHDLGLKKINIVANDFGGSIALSYAIKFPENVNRICIFNTWMWSLMDDPHYTRPAKFLRSWIGKVLYLHFGFSVNVIMPKAYGNKKNLSKNIHDHYKKALPTAKERIATYAFARELTNASDWWDEQWAQFDVIKTKPFLVFWGMKDPAILPMELTRWQNSLPSVKVIKLENAGHFVQEEEPEIMIEELRKFLK